MRRAFEEGKHDEEDLSDEKTQQGGRNPTRRHRQGVSRQPVISIWVQHVEGAILQGINNLLLPMTIIIVYCHYVH